MAGFLLISVFQAHQEWGYKVAMEHFLALIHIWAKPSKSQIQPFLIYRLVKALPCPCGMSVRRERAMWVALVYDTMRVWATQLSCSLLVLSITASAPSQMSIPPTSDNGLLSRPHGLITCFWQSPDYDGQLGWLFPDIPRLGVPALCEQNSIPGWHVIFCYSLTKCCFRTLRIHFVILLLKPDINSTRHLLYHRYL